LTFDLAQILPPEASVEFHQDMATSTTAVNSSQKQTMDMKMDLNLHIESK